LLQAATGESYRVVPHSDLKIVDPISTTAYITRNFGYLVYDTLFASDEQGEIRPQMVDTYERSADKEPLRTGDTDVQLVHSRAHPPTLVYARLLDIRWTPSTESC